MRETKETKDEFEDGYRRRSGQTAEEMRRRGLATVECRCGESGCRGWRVVIADKMRLLQQLQGITVLP